ncbi:MAG: hypothetical protein C4530_03625 [Desulfobacteraceae bacterium]|nr:MAG: hypothetical protein C4530_03625 [Desulfobacteraceae bacterium]
MKSERLKEEIEAFEKNPLQNLTVQDAMIIVVVCGARVKAEDCSEDIARIAELVQSHSLFSEYREDTVRRINRIVNMMRAGDCKEAVSAAAGILSEDLKKLSLRWSAHLAAKEGGLTRGQKRHLFDLVDPLSIERKKVESILEAFST